jgi:hypothetical protein
MERLKSANIKTAINQQGFLAFEVKLAMLL